MGALFYLLGRGSVFKKKVCEEKEWDQDLRGGIFYVFTLSHSMLPKQHVTLKIILKMKNVTAEWRRLRYEELNDQYSQPNIIWVVKSRRMRWVGHVAHMGERRCAYKIFVGKLEGKRPLERPWRRWEDNIKVDDQEVGWDMDWIDLAQHRDSWRTLVNAVMNLRFPKMRGISWLPENPLASEEILCSME